MPQGGTRCPLRDKTHLRARGTRSSRPQLPGLHPQFVVGIRLHTSHLFPSRDHADSTCTRHRAHTRAPLPTSTPLPCRLRDEHPRTRARAHTRTRRNDDEMEGASPPWHQLNGGVLSGASIHAHRASVSIAVGPEASNSARCRLTAFGFDTLPPASTSETLAALRVDAAARLAGGSPP